MRRGPFSGYADLWFKDESSNPTGSFKARGMTTAVSMASLLGAQGVALPTAGNAGSAAAAYAARAGLPCAVAMPADTPSAIVAECAAYGANVVLLRGLINDCGRFISQVAHERGWLDLSTLKEPYRVEGKKTMGYELAEDFGWELPDAILYPTGGGTGLVGMWKAFAELAAMGFVGSKRPRMYAVQAEGCAPIVKAFLEGKDDAPLWEGATTHAHGLRVPKALGDFLILEDIYASGGEAVAASDAELMRACADLARLEGMLAAPESGAGLAAIQKLVRAGTIGRDDIVVLFSTGSGYKYLEAWQSAIAQ